MLSSSDWKLQRALYRLSLAMKLENVLGPKSLSSFSLLFCCLCLIFQPAIAQGLESDSSALSNRIQHLLDRPEWEASFWGIHIVSLKDGSTLFSSNDKKRFLPASNMKLLIAAAALDMLGPEFRFETSAFGEGPVDSEGRLMGNLVLVGRGDPNTEGRIYDLNQEDLPKRDIPQFVLRLADQLVARGIKAVLGDVIADETLFLHEPIGQGWSTENLTWGYGSPVSSLSVNENSFALEILPGAETGLAALIRTYPIESGIEFANRVTTSPRTEIPWIAIERSSDGLRCTLAGRIPVQHAGLTYNLAATDPALLAARLLRLALLQKGIPVSGQPKSRLTRPIDVLNSGKVSVERARALQILYPETERLASVSTTQLSETLRIMLKVSQNLYAETLLRDLGAQRTGLGSVQTGLAELEAFLVKTGTPAGVLGLNDGSGLSRKNLVSPESVVRLLQFMNLHPYRTAFLDALPVSGHDGTLRYRMAKGPAAGHIFAKTGSLDSVHALSGYVVSETEPALAFSIMVNNDVGSPKPVREAIDQICQWMAESIHSN